MKFFIKFTQKRSINEIIFLQVWNLETMLPIQTLIRHEAAVLSIALQGDLLLSGSEDNDVKVIISLYYLLKYTFSRFRLYIF